VQFSTDGRIRLVLKPYYGFVYDDTGWEPCTVTEDSSVPGAGLYRLSLVYSGERKVTPVLAAVIGDSLFFRWYRKYLPPSPVAPASASAPVPGTGSVTSAGGNPVPPPAVNAKVPGAQGALDGFYIATGTTDALRLYASDPLSDFYCYYFTGSVYYRIRYWAADVRFRDINANFTGVSGEQLSVPKFFTVEGTLYTCITSTGSILRNYEHGTYQLKDGFLSFKPDNIVFARTEAWESKPLQLTVSPDGSLLALGKPYLVRSSITDLDAEIKTHNGLRRPARKPVFDLMQLDFHWDEVDRIRNNEIPAP
jgi:hypothetical protein